MSLHDLTLPAPLGRASGVPALRPRPRFHVSPLAAWAALLVAAALLAGCASGPSGSSGRGTATPLPGTSTRDGAPAEAPADLIKVPDAQPKVEPIRQGGPNKPYVVLGQGYEPLVGDVAFKQRGMASWYGTKFHGRRTASGEVYSMYGMTAAHRTLPIPSYARVREVRSGKEIIVRINDRGPFHSSRVLDLSYTAALKLGALARGSVEVEIERLTFEDIRTGRWRSGDAPDTAVAAIEPRRLAMAPAVKVPSGSGASIPMVDVGSNPSAANAAGLAQDSDPVMALAERLEAARPLDAPADQVGGAGESRRTQSPPESRARAFTPGSKGYWVQLAAFRQREGVDEFQKRVAQEVEHLAPLLAVYQEGLVYRLQAGPYGERDEAREVARRMREALRLEPVVVERR